jgi:pimeloyl-ACP methyl ester carboxylesterase
MLDYDLDPPGRTQGATMTDRQDPVELAADVTGSGPVTVLLHGITEDARSWDPLVAPLAEDRTVVTVDLRGHGRSPQADRYDPAAMARDVGAALARLDLGGPDPLVIGHSLGGLVAVAYAASHATRGVIDVDQPLDLAGFQAQVRQLEPVLRSDQFGAAIEMMFQAMVGPLGTDEAARINELRRPRQEVVLGVWAPLLELSTDELDALVQQVVGGIEVPVLSLHGIDPGEDYPGWLQQRVPTAEVEIWADHGHYPHLLDPERFLRRVRDFDPQG